MEHNFNPTQKGEENKNSLLDFKKTFKKRAFTLSEALITLAVIGVIAAITIPTVVIDTQQQEYKTRYAKAVKSLNEAIMAGQIRDHKTPYNNTDGIHKYLQKNMNVVRTITHSSKSPSSKITSSDNYSFYTSDGMRFDFMEAAHSYDINRLHDIGHGVVYANSCPARKPEDRSNCGRCGSYGLVNNPHNTTIPPCIITVDVNGDKKPTAMVTTGSGFLEVTNKKSSPDGSMLTDIFSILITENGAIPYGTAAQKAMYNFKFKYR